MPELIQKEIINDGMLVREKTRFTSVGDSAPIANATNTATNVVWFFTGMLLVLLAFRFVLMLLVANQDNAFAYLIDVFSYPFAAPFFGLFNYTIRYGVSQFELSTLVAMAVYSLVASGIVRLINLQRV